MLESFVYIIRQLIRKIYNLKEYEMIKKKEGISYYIVVNDTKNGM